EWAENATLGAGHGEGGREHRLAPAELFAQLHGVGAVGVKHQRADERLESEARRDDPPAVINAAAAPPHYRRGRVADCGSAPPGTESGCRDGSELMAPRFATTNGMA